MKAVVICKEILTVGASKGAPDIGTGYNGFVQIGNLPGAYAIYIITGSGAQLTTIDGHANTIGGLVVTASGPRWPELDQQIPAGLRTKINTYRQAQGQGNIPVNTTLLQVVRFAANHFDFGNFDVWDGGGS